MKERNTSKNNYIFLTVYIADLSYDTIEHPPHNQENNIAFARHLITSFTKNIHRITSKEEKNR